MVRSHATGLKLCRILSEKNSLHSLSPLVLTSSRSSTREDYISASYAKIAVDMIGA